MTNGANQGLFVIVAVVTFGIFVTISYLLFQDKLQTGLATIFTDSIEDSVLKLTGKSSDIPTNNTELNIEGTETEDGYIITKIRTGNGADISDVWVKAKINSDNTLTIESSNNVGKDFVSGTGGTSSNITGGSITIPSSINGKKLTDIGGYAFSNATFTGEFKAPSIQTIDLYAFRTATFTGKFNAPNIEVLGRYAFHKSIFTEDFNAPKLTIIGGSVFQNSIFTEEFKVPNATEIGDYAFNKSLFTGDFNALNADKIGNFSFQNSLFTGDFNAPKIKTLSGNAFRKSQFKGKFNAPNMETIGSYVFESSLFTGEFKAPNIIEVANDAFKNSNFDSVDVPTTAKFYSGALKMSNGKYYYNL